MQQQILAERQQKKTIEKQGCQPEKITVCKPKADMNISHSD